jgi:hypothetical protein
MPGETGLKFDDWKNSKKPTGMVKGGSKDTGLGFGLFNAGGIALDNQEDMAALDTGLVLDIWDPVLAAILAGEM